jgi:tetratricopeptide (TPR) repeat protein
LVVLTGQGLAQSQGLGPDAPAMAKQRYTIGAQLYRQGRYAEAAREFQVAQAIMPNSAKLAFNVARSLERSGELQAAYEMYGRYLELETDPKQRRQVMLVRAVLKETLDPQEPGPQPKGATRPTPCPPIVMAPIARQTRGLRSTSSPTVTGTACTSVRASASASTSAEIGAGTPAAVASRPAATSWS